MQRLHAPAPGAKPGFSGSQPFRIVRLAAAPPSALPMRAKAGVAPRQCSVLTSLKSRASVRSVASFLKSSARSHRSPRTCGGEAFHRAVTVQKLGGGLGADIAHEREQVGDERRINAKLFADSGCIANCFAPAIDLDRARIPHALRQILVRWFDVECGSTALNSGVGRFVDAPDGSSRTASYSSSDCRSNKPSNSARESLL